MRKSQHYWRHHARVTRRLWTDLPQGHRDEIAADVEQKSEVFKWFAAKVDADSERLYQDESHWDNDPWTFRYNQEEHLALAA